MKQKYTGNGQRPAAPDGRSARRTTLTKLTVIVFSLLVPGILFSFTQGSRVEDVVSEFVKADSQGRAALTKALIQKGKDAVPLVLPLLDNKDVEVQVRALSILEQLDAVDARTKIATKLTDTNPTLRAAAAKALGVLGDADTTPALLTALSDPDRGVRISSTLALGRLKAVAAAPVFRSILTRGDLDASERQAAIMSLGHMRWTAAVDDLISIATRTSEQENTRSIAVASLGEIGDTAARKPILDLIENPSETIRFNAAASLGSLGGAAAETALVRVLRNQHEADFIRIRAAWAIRNIGTDTGIRELLQVAHGENEFIAMHVVRVLVETKTPGGKEAAANLAARTKDAFVRSTLEKLIKDNVDK